MEINIPQVKSLSDAEKMIEAMPQICQAFHIVHARMTGLGFIGFDFADGSYVGAKPLLEKAFNFR